MVILLFFLIRTERRYDSSIFLKISFRSPRTSHHVYICYLSLWDQNSILPEGTLQCLWHLLSPSAVITWVSISKTSSYLSIYLSQSDYMYVCMYVCMYRSEMNIHWLKITPYLLNNQYLTGGIPQESFPSNLLSVLLRFATRPYELGFQRDSNSLMKVSMSSLLTITSPEESSPIFLMLKWKLSDLILKKVGTLEGELVLRKISSWSFCCKLIWRHNKDERHSS